MNQLLEWISRIVGAWKFWVIVPPWEVGIRVRLGKKVGRLDPGPHWRIPFLDQIILVNTRMRVNSTPPVTLPVKGDAAKIRTIKAVCGYSITNPMAAVHAFENPSVAVMGLAQAALSKDGNEAFALADMATELEGTGIHIDFLRYVEDVEIPALRLLKESWTVSSDHKEVKSTGSVARY